MNKLYKYFQIDSLLLNVPQNEIQFLKSYVGLFQILILQSDICPVNNTILNENIDKQ